MKTSEEQEVHRVMNNFSSCQSFNTILNSKQVDYWLNNYSNIVFCYGRLREVEFSKISDNHYKVTSREA